MNSVTLAKTHFARDGQNRDFLALKDVLGAKHKGVPGKTQGRPCRASLQTRSRAPLIAPGAILRGLSAGGSYVGAL